MDHDDDDSVVVDSRRESIGTNKSNHAGERWIVLTSKEIADKQREVISSFAETTEVDIADASLMLRQTQWSGSKLLEMFMDDPDAMRSKLGVLLENKAAGQECVSKTKVFSNNIIACIVYFNSLFIFWSLVVPLEHFTSV